jgi:Icc-related predicted phosphoesterase
MTFRITSGSSQFTHCTYPAYERLKLGIREKVQPEESATPDEYLAAKLRDALAADDRVAQLDIDIRFKGNQVTLGGAVGTDERRDAAAVVARNILPDHAIVNELQVVDLAGHMHEPGRARIRIAAVGDVHFGLDSKGQLRECIERIGDEADMLLLAGDLTRHGDPAEARVLAKDLEYCAVPVIAVLGNHDHQSDLQDDIVRTLNDGGVCVLEGTTAMVDVNGVRVGVAGTKGFGGGFMGACGSEFGERIQKEFIGHSRDLARGLQRGLESLDTDLRIALTHFSPVSDTLRGEPLEIYAWLGTYFLAEAMDEGGADWAFHGHAHAGTENGVTSGGVQVRNVAQPVIHQAYKVYAVESRALQGDRVSA